MLKTYQTEFIQLALAHKVLKFGDFTLKSGRHSPYFFNAGQFFTGEALSALGRYYAQTIMDANLNFDSLFGPAYKGIPLVSSVAIALANDFQINKPYSFNRKEAKDHGEGGTIVGAPLSGKVLIVDDVITAGTAIRQAVDIIHDAGASVGGIVLAFDRQERGQQQQSAVQELQESLQVPVISIIKFKDLREFMSKDTAIHEQLSSYHTEYGVNLS
jgi:orotate phosphoribosyltransferase